MELSISNKLFRNIKNNRWQHEFSDRENIGAGGFASVYKAKNCYDDQVYAVKKVKLQFKDIRKNFESELQKVLDEAKFLAKLKHDNILRYYGSWLEATTRPNKPGRRNLTIKPSIFKQEKENICSANEQYNDEGSPCVIFGGDNNDEEADEKDDSPAQFERRVEYLPAKKEGDFFARRLSKFNNNRRLDLHIDEGLKLQQKLRLTASEPQECSTPLVRGEKLQNIMLFIQTELCNDTLDSYINTRNEALQELRKQSTEECTKKRREYLREALTFALQILNGLSHIHSHHVVHRDLKPSNIFLAGKVCKIGDFGLVKQLVSYCPQEGSPSQVSEKSAASQIDKFVRDFTPLEDGGYNLTSKKSSDPSYGKDGSDTEDHITRNIGTRLFASPEQWMADKDTFDYRADIFSLGVTFLLLFHPMSTYMERNDMIQDSKDGKIPESLEKELPEIAGIIKKMLSLDPSARPSILEIIQSLKLPCEIRSQLQGSISFRRENALRWRKKHFKLIDSNLYLYNNETDKKAENIYTLFQWKITREFVEEDPKSHGSAHKGESEGQFRMNGVMHDSGDMCIKLENSDQLGCELKLEDSNAMEELFKAFEKYKGAY